MEGDMVVRKYEGYSGRMICGTLLEGWGGVWWEGDMRDVIGRMRWGMMGGGSAGRTTSPKSARSGCRFWPRPPANKGGETGTANDQRAEKKNAYFWFNLLIVNNINQYFNTHLHLIRFITYNRRIFIAKYLFDNKTCSIFVYVKITLTNKAYHVPL